MYAHYKASASLSLSLSPSLPPSHPCILAQYTTYIVPVLASLHDTVCYEALCKILFDFQEDLYYNSAQQVGWVVG